MKIKKTIVAILTAGTLGVSGSYTYTLNDINSFRDDLEIMGIETEQAQHLAEYFKGNSLVGKRESISISEMQAIVSVYNKVIQETEERNFGEIKDGKEFVKKMNKKIEKVARIKKN